MNIAQEIYEAIQELYQEIIKVDLNTGKATILHSIAYPSDRGERMYLGQSFRGIHEK